MNQEQEMIPNLNDEQASNIHNQIDTLKKAIPDWNINYQVNVNGKMQLGDIIQKYLYEDDQYLGILIRYFFCKKHFNDILIIKSQYYKENNEVSFLEIEREATMISSAQDILRIAVLKQKDRDYNSATQTKTKQSVASRKKIRNQDLDDQNLDASNDDIDQLENKNQIEYESIHQLNNRIKKGYSIFSKFNFEKSLNEFVIVYVKLITFHPNQAKIIIKVMLMIMELTILQTKNKAAMHFCLQLLKDFDNFLTLENISSVVFLIIDIMVYKKNLIKLDNFMKQTIEEHQEYLSNKFMMSKYFKQNLILSLMKVHMLSQQEENYDNLFTQEKYLMKLMILMEDVFYTIHIRICIAKFSYYQKSDFEQVYKMLDPILQLDYQSEFNLNIHYYVALDMYLNACIQLGQTQKMMKRFNRMVDLFKTEQDLIANVERDSHFQYLKLKYTILFQYHGLADKFIDYRYLENELEYFESLIQCCYKPNNLQQTWVSECYYIYYIYRKRFDKAKPYVEQHLQFYLDNFIEDYQKDGSVIAYPAVVQSICKIQAMVLFNIGHYNQALKIIDDSLFQKEQLQAIVKDKRPFVYKQVLLSYNKAVICYNIGKSSQVIPLIKQCMNWLNEYEFNYFDVIGIYSFYGEIMSATGHNKDTIKLFEKMEEKIPKRFKKTDAYLNALIKYMIVLDKMQSYQKSRTLKERLIELVNKTHNLDLKINFLNSVAYTYSKQQLYRRSYEVYKYATQIIVKQFFIDSVSQQNKQYQRVVNNFNNMKKIVKIEEDIDHLQYSRDMQVDRQTIL